MIGRLVALVSPSETENINMEQIKEQVTEEVLKYIDLHEEAPQEAPKTDYASQIKVYKHAVWTLMRKLKTTKTIKLSK